MERTDWPGLVRRGTNLFTPNLEPGRRVYDEDLVADPRGELRRWDPWRSKLAAYLLHRPPGPLPPRPRSILYLGAAHGTTASHLSDLLPEGTIFLVEKSPVAFAQLLGLAKRRPNLLPILGDAQLPERYAADVTPVDLVYQDVAQAAQASIFVENLRATAGPRAEGILMLKTRSVTQRRPGPVVLREAQREIARAGFKVHATIDLSPFSREHVALAVRA